jgi:hypothetical protein
VFGVIKMPCYDEISTILRNFFLNNIDRRIGDLSLNEVSQLADELDTMIYRNYEIKKKQKVI